MDNDNLHNLSKDQLIHIIVNLRANEKFHRERWVKEIMNNTKSERFNK